MIGDVLNLDETAEYLRVSNQTVYNMIRDGRIKAHKVGREWRLLKADLAAYLESTSNTKTDEYIRGWNDAVDAMSKRLTVDELREREWEPIWLVMINRDGIPFGKYDIVTKVDTYSMETRTGENLSLENMGKTWTAYAGKPK